jgi:uncharacterized protein (DUF169 family)
MADATNWSELSRRLSDALGVQVAPIAISFESTMPSGVPAFEDPMPAPNEVDGRTGRVSAGCVFWMKSPDRTFATVAEDHANCSVGSWTHGFKSLEEVAGNGDVAALLESGWVTMDMIPMITTVTEKPQAVVYGPLADATNPDVALLRITGRQLMVMKDAYPDLAIEGKPQCHIVAMAKEKGIIAASTGCQLSRVRTGMSNAEMTLAIPASRIAEVVEKVEATSECDNIVARYAANDATRFANNPAPRA